MRNPLTVIFLLFLYPANAQLTVSKNIQNLFDPNYRNITFLGMDFSMIKLVGDFNEALGIGGDANSEATKNAYFKSWNNLVSGEREKYDIKKMVNNRNIVADIAAVMELNNATKVDDLTGYKEPAYTKDIIKEHIRHYKIAGDKGLGVVLLMECFNKNEQRATINFVVLDIETKEIVLLKKLQTGPRGSGLRNYWAGSIYEAFKEVEKSFAKGWRSEYNWN